MVAPVLMAGAMLSLARSANSTASVLAANTTMASTGAISASSAPVCFASNPYVGYSHSSAYQLRQQMCPNVSRHGRSAKHGIQSDTASKSPSKTSQAPRPNSRAARHADLQTEPTPRKKSTAPVGYR